MLHFMFTVHFERDVTAEKISESRHQLENSGDQIQLVQ